MAPSHRPSDPEAGKPWLEMNPRCLKRRNAYPQGCNPVGFKAKGRDVDTALGPQKGDPEGPGRVEACRGSWRLGRERRKEGKDGTKFPVGFSPAS